MKKVFTLIFVAVAMLGFSQEHSRNGFSENLDREITKPNYKVAKTMDEVFFEDFEGFETANPAVFEAAGWGNFDVDADGNRWFVFQTTNFTKVATSASWQSNVPLTPNNWLVTPAIDLTGYSGQVDLDFRVFAQDIEWYEEKYKVVVSTTGNTVADFSDDDIVHVEVLPGDDIYERNVDLSAYAGETIYLAFVHFDCTDWFRINLDNIKVSAEPGGVTPQTHQVTFNVDLTDAEGFDYSTHEVWITGDLLGWSTPGTGDSKQLSLVDKRVDEVEEYYFEGFETSPDASAGLLPEGWTQKRTATLDATPTTDATSPMWFRHQPGVYGFTTNAADYVRTGDAAMAVGFTATQFTWAISPDIEIPAKKEGGTTLEFWTWYTNVGGSGTWPSSYYVKVHADGVWTLAHQMIGTAEVPNNIWEEAIEVDMEAYEGKTIKLAFIYEYTDGYQMAIDDVKIYGTPSIVEPPDELIYTVTIPVEEDGKVVILYKFFSNAFGAGWAGGEWPGDPNRSATITGDVTLDHVWGVQTPSSIDEIALDFETKVFPNPVRGILTVQSKQNIDNLRLLDITGRQVLDINVNGLETSIDVRNFTQGLYILQIMSGNQVKTHKIQVAR